ncbi:protein artemis isoform X3 [Strongylocentrotus purpuratus]|uniref:Metallo-beta-lactamase domain-containing protein n=1 Tax=Strongylocentrotus purpuratus TaxID=7668 RepID=A0A7M7PY56_STRPU|nr:protein artemis isoform X3 [Strongylocentrotus purpuratus]
MSTFGGLMVEYPQIAIDRFQGDAVLRARGYFLSHCHTDHMVGLSSKKFADRLKCNPHIRLYCSEVTYEFLLTDDKYKHLQASLSSLPIEQTSTVALVNEFNGQEEKLLVTLLPAGHCPGSVMFLFEGDQGTVLYTGDFRLAKGEAARMEPLHSGSRVKDIISVYLDTTFCVPEAMYIPSRGESKDALLDLVDSHISKSAGHMVKLNCKAKYGYEYLFVELSKTFNQKIHVCDTLMKQYNRVPDLCYHLTTEGSLTQIHACRYGPCSLKNATNILSITPSTMWFTGNARPEDVIRKIRDFLGYIRPQHVYPNVIPYGSSEEEVVKRLQDCLRSNKRGVIQDHDVSIATNFQPFGSLKDIRNASRKRQHADHQTEEDFRLLFECSPEKRDKKGEPSSSRGHLNHTKDSEGSDSKLKKESRDYGEREGGVDGEGHISDALPWEQGNGTKESSYSCTFADSDGVLSDSDESHSGAEGDNHSNDILSFKDGRTKSVKKIKCKAGHKSNRLKIEDDDERTREDQSSGSDDDDEGLVEGEKEGRQEEEYQEESQPVNPSQSSTNDGSMALFSDDSHPGDSQRSGGSLSSTNWLQYLPTMQQTLTKTPPTQEKEDDDRLEVIGDVAHKDTGRGHHDNNPSSPILISDDDDVIESDSDATHICSQRSVRSEGSSVNDIKVISMTPSKHNLSPGCSLKTRGFNNGGANLKQLEKYRSGIENAPNHSRTDTSTQPSSVAIDKLSNVGSGGSRYDNVIEDASSLESVIEITSSS